MNFKKYIYFSNLVLNILNLNETALLGIQFFDCIQVKLEKASVFHPIQVNFKNAQFYILPSTFTKKILVLSC